MGNTGTEKTRYTRTAVCISKIGGRPEQQDAEGFWHSATADLAVVADGAGGHKGGAAASSAAVKTLQSIWENELAAGVSAEQSAEILKRGIIQAHHAILEQGNGNSELCGKSAIVVVYLHDGHYTVLNAGDCRAYIAGEDGWTQLTRDDSLLQLELENGMVTPEEAVDHPDQSVLTQALGGHSAPKPHVVQGEYTPKNDFLLCCDGLWNQLPAGWAGTPWNPEETVEAHADMLDSMGEQAVAAKSAKSDNVSAVWIFCTEAEREKKPTSLRLIGIATAFILSVAALLTAWFTLPPACCGNNSRQQEAACTAMPAPDAAETTVDTAAAATVPATESTEEPPAAAPEETTENAEEHTEQAPVQA